MNAVKGSLLQKTGTAVSADDVNDVILQQLRLVALDVAFRVFNELYDVFNPIRFAARRDKAPHDCRQVPTTASNVQHDVPRSQDVLQQLQACAVHMRCRNGCSITDWERMIFVCAGVGAVFADAQDVAGAIGGAQRVEDATGLEDAAAAKTRP
eukprot:387134_1